MDYENMLKDIASRENPSEASQTEGETPVGDNDNSNESIPDNEGEAQAEASQESNESPNGETEDSSLTSDNAQESTQEQQAGESESGAQDDDDAVVVETDEDMLKFMSGHYEKEFDLEKFKSFVEGKDNEVFANDTVKEINDWVSKGGDLKDYYELKMTDYDNMEDMEIVRREYQQKYPSLSKEQLERKLNRDFKLDEDSFDEDEVEDAKIELKLLADQARGKFKEKSSQYPASLENKAKEQAQAQSPEISQEEVLLFQKGVKDSLKSLSKIEAADGFTYEVKENLKGKVENSPLDLGELFVEGDNFNYDKYNQARYVLNNFDDIVQSAIEHGKSQQLKSVKEQRNNSSYEESPRSSPQVTTERESLEKISQLMGGNGGMKI